MAGYEGEVMVKVYQLVNDLARALLQSLLFQLMGARATGRYKLEKITVGARVQERNKCARIR